MHGAAGYPERGSQRTGQKRPQLRSTIEVLHNTDGSTYLVLPGTRPDLVFASTPLALALLDALDGTRTAHEIAVAIASTSEEEREVGEAIDELWDGSALQDTRDGDSLSELEADRFDRQIRYLRDLSEPDDPVLERHRQVRSAHVAVLGVGGLGSWTALCLTAAGVGRLTLIDDDRVEVGNLARQALFAAADVGRKKVTAGAEALERLHPDVEVTAVDTRIRSADELVGALHDADVVVSTADWPAGRIDGWVGEACATLGVVSMTVAQHPPLVRLGPLLVPGITACHACRERGLARTHPHYQELAELRAASSSQAATFAGTSAILGGWAATEVVHYLSGLPSASLGRAHIIDVRTLATTIEPWTADPRCACSAARRSPPR